MAEHGTAEYATATGNDYAEHQRTYVNVTHLAKVGTFAAAALVISLAAYGVGGIMWLFALGLVLTIGATAASLGSGSGSAKPVIGVIILVLILWAIAR
jgi:hypothetical protein